MLSHDKSIWIYLLDTLYQETDHTFYFLRASLSHLNHQNIRDEKNINYSLCHSVIHISCNPTKRTKRTKRMKRGLIYYLRISVIDFLYEGRKYLRLMRKDLPFCSIDYHTAFHLVSNYNIERLIVCNTC